MSPDRGHPLSLYMARSFCQDCCLLLKEDPGTDLEKKCKTSFNGEPKKSDNSNDPGKTNAHADSKY